MESNRSAKRRKLDREPQEGGRDLPSNSRHEASAIVTTDKPPVSRATTIAHGTNSTNGTSTPAHQAWQEAKAKSRALKGKRIYSSPAKDKQADVYDDIEGAHAHQSPLKKRSTPTTLPAKKPLDPLRNQRSDPAPTSSPAKGGAALGFFKQFHKPKPAVVSNVVAEKSVNGDGPKHKEGADDVQAGAEEYAGSSDEDEEADSAQDTPVRSSGKGSWKGWAYANKPKKTFEDEIREVADAAREQAEKDESGNAVAASSLRRRNRVSSSTPNGSSVIVEIKNKHPSNATPKQKSPPERRRNHQTAQVEAAAGRDDELEDRMDLDVADEVLVPIANDKHATKETVTPTKSKPQQRSKVAEPTVKVTFTSEQLSLIQMIILEKLAGRRPISMTIFDLNDEYNRVSKLITQTITAGESNSMLLIGSRGSGKTALVNQILREQAVEHPEDFLVVRLNGFIHTDDKIALREIWRQLGREMEHDDEESTSKNYADTLTTLLALLSHPAEHGQEQPDQMTKSVIFILDEFELFASHPRQTLLYNLFDIAQSRKAPIAVLGLTTRVDVAESLEKRVKSRFSHRYVHLGLPKTFRDFWYACTAAILISSNEVDEQESKLLGAPPEAVAELDQGLRMGLTGLDPRTDWNASVGTILTEEIFDGYLRRLYYTTKSIPEFHASMLMSMSAMPVDASATSNEILEYFANTIGSTSLAPPDSKLTLLSSLSTLQLALLICAARLTAIHSIDTVPFIQAYEEYKVLASKAKLQASASGALAQGAGSRIWSKNVAKVAWDDLIEMGLVLEDGSRGGRVDIGLEEIGLTGVELGSWGRWCREI